MKQQLNHLDLVRARNAYDNGVNIIDALKSESGSSINTSSIIEIAYDLQAGSYIEHAKNNHEQHSAYTGELAKILSNHIRNGDSLLDIGTGEMTTLTGVLNSLNNIPKYIYAFDISWSRIFKGRQYLSEFLKEKKIRVKSFVADIRQIPLLDNSISITTSSHALEPNGGSLDDLLKELFRVTKDKLVLFEPCYELNSKEGQDRMDKLGYIKEIDRIVIENGGIIEERFLLSNINNPLNPTACYIITPPEKSIQKTKKQPHQSLFSVPGTDLPLIKQNNFYINNETGLCFPVIKDIAILKCDQAILANALCE